MTPEIDEHTVRVLLHSDVRNPEAYLDRTLQNWHRSLPGEAYAKDLDLTGFCPNCCRYLYAIESTQDERRIQDPIVGLVRHHGIPAFIAYHRGGTSSPHAAREVHADGTSLSMNGLQFEVRLQQLRDEHTCGS